MKLAHLTLVIAIAATATACATEGSVAPSGTARPRLTVSTVTTEVPMLYVVDGVRLQRDQVPSISSDQVLSVSVVKGHMALQKYGPDAAYGVVVIKTKAANAPQT